MRFCFALVLIWSTIFVQCKDNSSAEGPDNQSDISIMAFDAELIEIQNIEEEIDSLHADIDSLLFLIEEY